VKQIDPADRKPTENVWNQYQAFLRRKVQLAQPAGFEVELSEIHPVLKPHQRIAVQWAVRGGQRAIFMSFGLGKTLIQIETVRLTLKRCGGMGLIVLPLGVRQEFMRDAAMIGVHLKFIRRIEEAEDTNGIYLTNYETIRDKKMDPRKFSAISLDEASVLRGFGGTKTFREFMNYFEGSGKFRFVATATPDPNEFIELLAYAGFLDVMDIGQAKTRWFKRDSEHAGALTLHPHKEREFWLWVSSWALFVQKPSDLGFDDTGYALPEMTVRWHELPSDHAGAGAEKDGQGRMFRNAAYGVTSAAAEKRDSLPQRIEKLMKLRAEDPGAHRIIWHDLEAERYAIQKAIPDAVAVFGNQDLEEREEAIIKFSDGGFQELSAKPVIAGSGCNFQRHCAWAIFLGIGFKFNDLIQAVHRIYRFLQDKAVTIDLIYTEAERPIRQILEAKWARHTLQTEKMAQIIREYGLAHAAIEQALHRSIGVERNEASGENYRLICNDAVEETLAMESESTDLIITSIPFAFQYEYTPSYNDFGHTDSNEHFWQQMDFLTPELLRVLRPGRVMAIHVKDRITPGGITGLGFQTVTPFHAEAIFHYRRQGFAYLGMKTVVTDVVRENNQTYRLGWTEQCKDGSRMGVGMPEYVLLFRRPPTDSSDGYADTPVLKDKKIWERSHWKNENGYSRARWQLDAHGFARSNGNHLVAPEDLVGLAADVVYKTYREFSLKHSYDFEHHVACAEALEAAAQLPKGFMLLPPQSWHEDVWSDVARMRTLNMNQERKGREMHLCPLQFDIVDRLIVQFSMPGETIFDPFCGLGTVPYCAVKLKRRGLGIELNSTYFRDAAGYCEVAEREGAIPTLFDFVEAEESAGGAA
jgi:DNA modification methylase